MGSGSILRRPLAFFWLCALPLLAGCFQYDQVSTLSWSPSGSRVAFISEGRAWIYALDTGRVSLLSEKNFTSLSWSPKEEWLALSSDTYVSTFREDGGAFRGAGIYYLEPGSDFPPLMMWNGSGDRLLVGVGDGEKVYTNEIDPVSGTVERLGSGIGMYGGEWLLWVAPVAVGRKSDKIVLDRQTRAGESLPLSREAIATFERGIFSLFSAFLDNSPMPLCVQRDDPDGASQVVCLDGRGRLDVRATLPSGGRIFADRERILFARLEEKSDEPPKLTITDGFGKIRAEGADFLRRIEEVTPLTAAEGSSLKVSRLAFSPDGNWIAWVVRGHLCLWNWRNDVVRIYRPG